MSLPDTLADKQATPDGFIAEIPESWMQGRTSYGGFSSALALAGAQRLVDGLPPLRSATVNFVGPLAGEVEVRGRVLRRGRNATWIAVEVLSEGNVGLAATFVFMGPVASELHISHLPPPASLIAVEEALPMPEGRGPGFIPNFEVRFALPRRAEPEPHLEWWVRLRDRVGLDPMIELLALADALPPGVMPLLRKGPVSSMTWLVNLLTPAPQTREGWFLLRSAGNYAEQGCSSQDMAMWNTDGEAVAAGMQSIAVFA